MIKTTLFNMGIDTIVDMHPERLETVNEVEEILSKIKSYEEKMDCKAGIVLKQNRQLGGSYRIVSEKEANKGINNPGICEWYIKFYSRSYFEELKEKLNGDKRSD